MKEVQHSPAPAREISRPLITFIYLGRSPAFGRFVQELARAASDVDKFECEFIVADDTDLADTLERQRMRVHKIKTFKLRSPLQVFGGYLRARRQIPERLAQTGARAAITLMPHVWSPLLGPAIQRRGVRYATVIHDAEPHPGDPTAWATRWLTRDANRADVVFTLSQAVAAQLVSARTIPPNRIVRLFHPDLSSGSSHATTRKLDPSRPFRVLFFGRIMAYKGLPLLIEAVRLLQGEGISVTLGVAGSGSLDGLGPSLEAVGAEVINRWLDDNEVGGLLARYDAMACSHVEASQSGIAALAFGNCMPVVATPVGGISEQVVHGRTGVLAADATPRALANAIHQLGAFPGLYDQISGHLSCSYQDRSMDRFLAEVWAAMGEGAPT